MEENCLASHQSRKGFFFFPEKTAKMLDFKISCEESCVFFSLFKLFLCLFARS